MFRVEKPLVQNLTELFQQLNTNPKMPSKNNQCQEYDYLKNKKKKLDDNIREILGQNKKLREGVEELLLKRKELIKQRLQDQFTGLGAKK